MNLSRRSLLALAALGAASCRMPANVAFDGEPFARLKLLFES